MRRTANTEQNLLRTLGAGATAAVACAGLAVSGGCENSEIGEEEAIGAGVGAAGGAVVGEVVADEPLIGAGVGAAAGGVGGYIYDEQTDEDDDEDFGG